MPHRRWDSNATQSALMALGAMIILGEQRPAVAHPVSLGSARIVVLTDRVSLQLTVSTEEVFLAASTRGLHGLDAIRGHGDYLLAHLRVTADGRTLAGRVVERPEKLAGRPSYRLEYRFERRPPAQLVFREDVLREIPFAPGIAWEASYLVHIGHDEQSPTEGLLTYRQPFEFTCRWGAPSSSAGTDSDPLRLRTIGGFVRHGVMHILTGYDHLLFVGALLLPMSRFWDLTKVILAFTLAHTFTLAVSAAGLLTISGRFVEPMIAASIIAVAFQNVAWPDRCRGGLRLSMAFLFGLFHGLGFAGGLLDAIRGLPSAGTGIAIGAFSVGVEIGHQVVILPAFAALCIIRGSGAAAPIRGRRVQRYGSVVLLIFGMVYLVFAIRPT